MNHPARVPAEQAIAGGGHSWRARPQRGSSIERTADALPRQGGRVLDPPVRAAMERRFGHELGDVRIHDDAWAHASARALGAKAYTVGSHVVFGAGRYAPQERQGERLLAHELAHVVQQRGSTAARAPLAFASPTAEREAQGAADAALRGAPVSIGRHEQAVAREPEGPSPDAPAPAQPAEDLFADPVLATFRVDAKGKVVGFDIDSLSAKVHKALAASKDAKILVRGSAAPGGDAITTVDEAAYNVRAALIQWLGKKTFPDIEKRIQYYAGFGLPSGSDKGKVVVTVQGAGVPAPSLPPTLIQPPGVGPFGAPPSTIPAAPPPAPTPAPGPSLGDMLTLKFKGGPVEFEVTLPKSAKAKLPVSLGSARVLTIELSAAASGDFGFAIWLDGTIPAVRVGLKAGAKVEKDKPVMGSAGLVVELLQKSRMAANPEVLKAKIIAAGEKFKKAYEEYRAETDGGKRTEKLLDMASAIGEMYDAVDKSTKPAEPTSVFTFEFGGKYPLTEPPEIEPDPLKRPAPYIGGTVTWRF